MQSSQKPDDTSQTNELCNSILSKGNDANVYFLIIIQQWILN